MHAFVKAQLLLLAAQAGAANIPRDSLIGEVQPNEMTFETPDREAHIDPVRTEEK